MTAEIKLKRNVFWAAGFSAVMLAGATPALAGFGYTGPMTAPAPAAAPSPAPAAAPAAHRGINWDNGPSMPAQKVPGIEAIPLTPAKKGSPSTTAQGPDFVSGFGKDLPLLVALQQVVPPQYKVSLAPGVDGNKHVSWQGERPWEQVLSDMLAPKGLVFAMRGDALVVKPAAGGRPVASRAVSSRSKIDMIPDDMVSAADNNAASSRSIASKEISQPAEWAPPPLPAHSGSSGPISMIARNKPALVPIPEAEVAQEPAPVSAYEPPAPAAVPQAKKVMTPVSPVPVAQTVTATAAYAPEGSPVISPAWHAARGQTLRTTLEDWSKAAHVQLYWSTDYDYKLNGDIAYGGSFEEAVGRLFDQFSAVKPQPYGQLHKNPETGTVLVVNTYGTYN